MEETKPWYMSRAVWGALIALTSSGVMIAGQTITPEIQSGLADILTLLGTAVGSALALYGRLVANSKIG